jgi:hypothetical protein
VLSDKESNAQRPHKHLLLRICAFEVNVALYRTTWGSTVAAADTTALASPLPQDIGVVVASLPPAPPPAGRCASLATIASLIRPHNRPAASEIAALFFFCVNHWGGGGSAVPPRRMDRLLLLRVSFRLPDPARVLHTYGGGGFLAPMGPAWMRRGALALEAGGLSPASFCDAPSNGQTAPLPSPADCTQETSGS